MKLNYISCLIAASIAATALSVSAKQISPLIFNSTPPQNDLVGSLAARVQFAQSQIIPANPKEEERQPILISLRKSLLLVQPLQADGVTPMELEARDASGKLLGSLTLSPRQSYPRQSTTSQVFPKAG